MCRLPLDSRFRGGDGCEAEATGRTEARRGGLRPTGLTDAASPDCALVDYQSQVSGLSYGAPSKINFSPLAQRTVIQTSVSSISSQPM